MVKQRIHKSSFDPTTHKRLSGRESNDGYIHVKIIKKRETSFYPYSSRRNDEKFVRWAKPHFMEVITNLTQTYIEDGKIPIVFVIDNKRWKNTRHLLDKFGDKIVIYAVNYDPKEDDEENINPLGHYGDPNAFRYKCYAHTLMKILIEKDIKLNIVHYDGMQIMNTMLEDDIFKIVGDAVDRNYNDVIYTISNNNISQGKKLKKYNFDRTWSELQNIHSFEDVESYIDIYKDWTLKEVRKELREKCGAKGGAGKTMFSKHVQYANNTNNRFEIIIRGSFENVIISITKN